LTASSASRWSAREAGEVLAALQTAVLANLPYPTPRDAVTTHLTVAEGLGTLLSNVRHRAGAIDIARRTIHA
jgi:hypothetical protein